MSLGWGCPLLDIVCSTMVTNKFMAHSAVWDHSPIQRQNANSKTLTIEKLSKSCHRRCTKYGRAHSNNGRKITLSLILYFIWSLRI